jgi:hypothetical protein
MGGKNFTVTHGRRTVVSCRDHQTRWDAVRAVKRLHFGVRIFSHAEDDSTFVSEMFQKHDDWIGADLEDEQRFDIPLTARQIETLYTAFEFYRKHRGAPKPTRVKPLSSKKEARLDNHSEMDDCGYDLMRPYEDALSASETVPPGAPDLRADTLRRKARNRRRSRGRSRLRHP